MADARELLESTAWATDDGVYAMRDALLAVLDLHEQRSNMGDPWCVHDSEDWPCDTVRTIDRALGCRND